MSVGSAFWRNLRQDFETLQTHKFSLWWNSSAQSGLVGNTLGKSHWAWWDFPDESLKARLSAIVLRGARALGFDSEDDWYEQLRIAKFVTFEAMGSSLQKRPDGEFQESDFGAIEDVVKESITLCFKLETDAALVENPMLRTDAQSAVPAKTPPVSSKRAAWLQDRLKERSWGKSDPNRHSGPDRKTIEKILRGVAVREDVLERLAAALSAKYAKVDPGEIPQD